MIQSKDSLCLMEPSYIVRTLLVGRNDVHTCDSFNLKCPTLWSEWLTCIFIFIHFAFMQGFLHFVPNSNPFYSNSINFSPNSKCYLNLQVCFYNFGPITIHGLKTQKKFQGLHKIQDQSIGLLQKELEKCVLSLNSLWREQAESNLFNSFYNNPIL